MKHVGWCLLAALLYVLSFPPADLGWLGFVALWPWCRMARGLSGWRLLLAGYLTGILILGGGCFWLTRASPFNLILMVLPESVYFGLFAWLLRRALVTHRWPAPVALPVVFVAMELGRSRFPLDGFPWLLLGYSQHGWLPLVQVSDLVGVMGVSALLAATAGALDHWFQGRGSGRPAWRAGVAVGVVLVAAHAYGFARLAEEDTGRPGPRVLLVQPNIEQRLKNSSDWSQVLQRNFGLTRMGLKAAQGPVHLVAWSETMLPVGSLVRDEVMDVVWREQPPYTPSHARRDEQELVGEISRQLLQPGDTWFLAGAMSADGDVRDGSFRSYNSAALYDPAGQRRALYDKTVLVPGGEYLPWIDAFPRRTKDWIRDLVHKMAGFVPDLERGAGPVRMTVPGPHGDALLGTTICYEIAYPDYGRRVVATGAEMLANLSNEAWFPDSAEFEQYTAMAVFRATEVRRDLIRCANSGTSGLIDAWGRVLALEEKSSGRRDGFPGTMLVEPRLRDGSTPYARWGDWLAWVALAAAVVLLVPRRMGERCGVTRAGATPL